MKKEQQKTTIQYKPDCTQTEEGQKFEISTSGRKKMVLSVCENHDLC